MGLNRYFIDVPSIEKLFRVVSTVELNRKTTPVSAETLQLYSARQIRCLFTTAQRSVQNCTSSRRGRPGRPCHHPRFKNPYYSNISHSNTVVLKRRILRQRQAAANGAWRHPEALL